MGYLRILRSEQPIKGRMCALCAVGLGVFLSSMGLANKISRQNYMYDTALAHSTSWFNLLAQGDIRRAHQLTLITNQRVNVDDDSHLDAYYDKKFILLEDPEATNRRPYRDIRTFVTQDPMAAIVKSEGKCQVKFIERDYAVYRDESFRELFSLVFELTPNPHQPDKPLKFRLTLERRSYEGKAGVQWRITDKRYLDGGPPRALKTFAPDGSEFEIPLE